MVHEMDFKAILPELILASQSPARRELLESLGCKVHVVPTNADEYHGGTVGLAVVKELAERKMSHFLSIHRTPPLPVLTADTLICCEGMLVGKAADEVQACAQIRMLSGRSHRVCSGFALYLPSLHRDGTFLSGSDEAIVTFAALTDEEISDYVSHSDWRGAAGSYRIQGEAKRFIEGITGDFATVVGLPIQAISAILSSPGSL